MAEIEYEGIKIGGSKLMLLVPLLGTLGGGLWGGFEFYKDYMDMKEIIANIDTDAIAARNDVIETKLGEAIDYTRDIKNDLREDVMKMEDVVDRISVKTDAAVTRIETRMDLAESRIKAANNDIEATLEGVRNEMNSLQKDVTASIREVESNGRANEKDVRNTMRETETRIDEKMRIVEKDLKEILQEALDNPLAN
jgi:paraquat-inducible protein B